MTQHRVHQLRGRALGPEADPSTSHYLLGWRLDTSDTINPPRVPSQSGRDVNFYIGGDTSIVDAVALRIMRLTERIAALEQKVEALRIAIEDQSEVLKAAFQTTEPAMLRTISRAQAKNEIQTLFASAGETILYMSEIADRLNLPDSLVVELCTELLQEGEIKVNDGTLPSR